MALKSVSKLQYYCNTTENESLPIVLLLKYNYMSLCYSSVSCIYLFYICRKELIFEANEEIRKLSVENDKMKKESSQELEKLRKEVNIE